MKKILACVLVCSLISVPITSQIFADPIKAKSDVTVTDGKKPEIKETDSKDEISTTKKVLIALGSFVTLAAGIGFAMFKSFPTKQNVQTVKNVEDNAIEEFNNTQHSCFVNTLQHIPYNNQTRHHDNKWDYDQSEICKLGDKFVSCWTSNFSDSQFKEILTKYYIDKGLTFSDESFNNGDFDYVKEFYINGTKNCFVSSTLIFLEKINYIVPNEISC